MRCGASRQLEKLQRLRLTFLTTGLGVEGVEVSDDVDVVAVVVVVSGNVMGAVGVAAFAVVGFVPAGVAVGGSAVTAPGEPVPPSSGNSRWRVLFWGMPRLDSVDSDGSVGLGVEAVK